MRFDIGDFGFDVIAHERKQNGTQIREQFTIDLFYQGQPLSWHPHETGRDDFPGIPNRQVIEWVGQESVDVYENKGTEEKPDFQKVGTKRGADYRTRFWPSLMHQAEKCLVAELGGKRKGEVTDTELAKAAFTEPVELKTRSLEEAAEVLTARESIREG